MLYEISDEITNKFIELNINVRDSVFDSLTVQEDYYF